MNSVDIQKLKREVLELANKDAAAFNEILDFARELMGIMAAGNPAADG